MSEDVVMSWSELAELTHATQVERFNFCTCEVDEYRPYDDCPKEGDNEQRILRGKGRSMP